MLRMNRSPRRHALEVATVLLMVDGKVPLRTPCLISCSESVRGQGRRNHLVLSLSRWFIGMLNVTCRLGTSFSTVAMLLMDSLGVDVIDSNALIWIVRGIDGNYLFSVTTK